MATAYDYTFTRLDSDEPLPLSQFEGSALLVVNVASACGYTPQYRDLQALHEAKAGKGLIVIGVPCNDFGAQEAGAEADIRSFCDAQYHVTFPMTGKVEIVGAGRHPFYQWIALEAGESALPRWNFHKYLIGRDGQLIDGFPSSAAPLGPAMLDAIKKALAA
jgi:glutathione peroxidase